MTDHAHLAVADLGGSAIEGDRSASQDRTLWPVYDRSVVDTTGAVANGGAMPRFMLIGLCEPPSEDAQSGFEEWFIDGSGWHGRFGSWDGPVAGASAVAARADGTRADGAAGGSR